MKTASITAFAAAFALGSAFSVGAATAQPATDEYLGCGVNAWDDYGEAIADSSLQTFDDYLDRHSDCDVLTRQVTLLRCQLFPAACATSVATIEPAIDCDSPQVQILEPDAPSNTVDLRLHDPNPNPGSQDAAPQATDTPAGSEPGAGPGTTPG